MALRTSFRNATSAYGGRPNVRCSAVPLGHLDFTLPAIAPVHAPATELVSFMTYTSYTKPFLVVQAPYDLLNTGIMYQLEADGDSDRKQMDAQDKIRDQVDNMQRDTNKKIDSQQGPLGLLNKLFQHQ
jgi:hypothetical protein